jgi:hypothetical protein
MRDTQKAKIDDIRFTILYDNVPYKKGLRTDWGVEGLDKTILFDAGRYDDIFLSNLTATRLAGCSFGGILSKTINPWYFPGPVWTRTSSELSGRIRV